MFELDLDIDFEAPEAVVEVLRTAADRYRDARYLKEREVRKMWLRFALILERAAAACDRTLERVA
jgi:hypothetical protein